MPLVKRGAGKSENERPSKKRKKEYDLLDNIGYKADLHHSLFRELPDGTEEAYTLIARYIVSFLNSSGGILAFGVRPNGVIYGEKISRCEEDHLKCAIDEGVKRIIPYVPSDKYSVSFTPVKGRHFDDKPSTVRQVLEIRVNPGDPYELYEDPKHEAFTRNENRLIGPLTPHQIKDITIAKLKKRIRAEKELAEVLSPAKSSTITSKKLVTGEGHKAVATRALSSKERIAMDREKTSSSKSSLATVVTVSSKIPSGKSGREKPDSEIGKKAQVPLDLESVGSTSGSSVTSKESSAAKDGACSKPSVSDNDSMSNKAKNISSSTALPSSNKVTNVVKDLKCTSVASTSSTTAISSASANPSTVAKSSTNTKPSTVAKSSVVTTSPTVAKPLTVGKPSAVTKLPTVAKPLAVAKPSTSKNVTEIKTSVAMKDKENCESKTSGTVHGTTKIAVSKPTNSITSQKSLAKPSSRKPLSIVNSSRATSTATHRPVVCSSNSFIRKKTVKLPPPPPPPPSFSQPSYPNVRPQPTGLFSYQPSNYNLPQPHTLQWYWDRHLQCYVQM